MVIVVFFLLDIDAVTIIRQMVYNVLASVDDVHEPQTLQRSATANVNNKRHNSNKYGFVCLKKIYVCVGMVGVAPN